MSGQKILDKSNSELWTELVKRADRIEAQAAVLRGLINWYGDDGEMGTDADLDYWVERARKALGEEKQ